jgi:hypothetical protein
MINKLAVIVLLGGLLLAAIISIGILVVQGVRSLNAPTSPTAPKSSLVLYQERPLYSEATLVDVRQWDSLA